MMRCATAICDSRKLNFVQNSINLFTLCNLFITVTHKISHGVNEAGFIANVAKSNKICSFNTISLVEHFTHWSL